MKNEKIQTIFSENQLQILKQNLADLNGCGVINDFNNYHQIMIEYYERNGKYEYASKTSNLLRAETPFVIHDEFSHNSRGLWLGKVTMQGIPIEGSALPVIFYREDSVHILDSIGFNEDKAAIVQAVLDRQSDSGINIPLSQF